MMGNNINYISYDDDMIFKLSMLPPLHNFAALS